ncbi:MAG: 23S rRNA (adenine(2503)-C(2))-methyltransferase RlmN [Proteobacteria bacterium]|nr:23S rRNA (adenine(2503)-C(2))-methyltransferase RlmN [Pseudomonadota bacterium]MBU4258346.1 23S rRNA (adenine(2503)-C(2))-methyltransferase RlmN [Pseudomonadota bacterium]MBU4286721.1 23S rRNA (adenine(2503)-C(2))-methyltransferase RlmN [Pseudomonadota bacterium]MBU4414619.1 23S rRNA (adenine(2503)-C(2))-methyltransferase RlmN [Pseudomonadota bacterium]MCG2759204.1 23S rRNA (adenine(2503)-C(2))-methyltransferase RlmN [Desulfobacteraceae bacterium]
MTTSTNKTDIKDLTRKQLASWLEEHDIEPYRAGQILKWIYNRQADTFDIMTDLGKEIRELLSLNFTINRLDIIQIETSQDGSKKYLFKLEDGKFIESVLIPERDYYTLCISSQVGCAQGCRFCLTAKGGFIRNLSKNEIVSQVRDVLKDLIGSKHITNIVFMGMGEPLANFQNVVEAIDTITDADSGLGFSNRRVTVSTAGLVSKLLSLGNETKINLAVSLNATDNRTRDFLMPVNKKYPIEELLDACRKYNLRPGGKITFEYILMKGVNDSAEDANRLAELLKGIRSKINLIPFNEYEGSDFRRPEESVINNFREIPNRKGYTVIIRHSKGQDISAACGQLSANRLSHEQLIK